MDEATVESEVDSLRGRTIADTAPSLSSSRRYLAADFQLVASEAESSSVRRQISHVSKCASSVSCSCAEIVPVSRLAIGCPSHDDDCVIGWSHGGRHSWCANRRLRPLLCLLLSQILNNLLETFHNSTSSCINRTGRSPQQPRRLGNIDSLNRRPPKRGPRLRREFNLHQSGRSPKDRSFVFVVNFCFVGRRRLIQDANHAGTAHCQIRFSFSKGVDNGIPSHSGQISVDSGLESSCEPRRRPKATPVASGPERLRPINLFAAPSGR